MLLRRLRLRGTASKKVAPRLCPAGQFGAVRGLPSAECSGPCPEGHYCPAGSINATGLRCGSAALFCPRGSGVPVVAADGYYTEGGAADARTRQQLCEPGYFCAAGQRHICRRGTFNGAFGLAADAKALGTGGEGALGFW